MKAYVNSAGYDLIADESVNVFPNSRAIISTGLRMCIPKGYYGEICSRSGLALKNGVVAFNGTIDSGYLVYVFMCYCLSFLMINFQSKKETVLLKSFLRNVKVSLFHLKILVLIRNMV